MSVAEIKQDQDNSEGKKTNVQKRLLSFVERIERIEEEKAAAVEDIKDIYTEVKAAGFCVKTTRKVVKLRAMDAEKRREEEDLLNVYKEQLNLF